MPALAEFQSHFAAALLDPQVPFTDRLGVGLAVYQNTVAKGLIDALRANYPTVERLVGTEWFDSVARLYAHEHLPTEPCLALYGDAFALFLKQFSSLEELPYVVPVAQLDRLWIEAHFAADDVGPLPAAELNALTSEQLQTVRLQLHPAMRFAWVPHSAATIWQNHRPPATPPDALQVDNEDEGILITRPAGAIRITRLTAAEFHFLQLIDAGELLSDAAVSVLDQYPDADLAAMLASLITAGSFSQAQVSGLPAKLDVRQLDAHQQEGRF
jgi:hypothetical protein